MSLWWTRGLVARLVGRVRTGGRCGTGTPRCLPR